MRDFVLPPAQLIGLKSLFFAFHRSRSAIDDYRNRQLHRLVRHAYEKVPYYRKLFDVHGVRPCDIQTIDDLRTIPITSKKDMQQSIPREVIARGVDSRNLIVHKTGGSTGEPSVIYRTWFEERLLQAFRHRAMFALGGKPTDKMFFVGRVRPPDPNDHQFFMRVANAFGIQRIVRADCFLPFSEIMGLFQQHHIDILYGLTGALFQFALEIVQGRHPIKKPRLVISGGEQITTYMRRQIEVAFDVPVFDTYGSHEFNLLAWECKNTGEYHLCDDTVILEVLKDGRPAKPGEQGQLIGTNLLSYAMPFIRYHLEDIVTQGSPECSCGAPFSTIQKIDGRMIDYLVVDKDKKIHPYQIVRLLVHDPEPWVRQYQIVQESVNRILLKVSPLFPVGFDKLQKIEKKVSSILGKDDLFRIELVPNIPRESSGKYVLCKSFVTSMYDN